MNETVIEFQDLTKIYTFGFLGKKQAALQDFSLKVSRGMIYGFLGANGAGKTTAIKILMGLQFASRGECLIFGKNPSDPEVKTRIGYLPERPYFHDGMTVDSFLNFHRSLFGSSLRGKKLLNNQELLNVVGLSQVAEKAMRNFSKGMLQRAGIAQALVNDPDILILDEPMSGLDPVGRKEVRDLILNLSQQGKTIFFSSHILSDVERICHRFALLEKGNLRFEGALADLKKEDSLRQEVSFSGFRDDEWRKSALLSPAIKSGETFLLKCDSPFQAKAAIEEIWQSGGVLVSCQPEQRNLEELLFGPRSKV